MPNFRRRWSPSGKASRAKVASPWIRFWNWLAAKRIPTLNSKSHSAAPNFQPTALQKPILGMSEPDRNISLASVLREEARIASASGQTDVAQEAISKLERSAAITRDLIVENNYESARGYALFAQGDLANAADELASDPHSPLALQQLAIAQEKLGNASAAESTRTRLKYQRAPTVEWYLTVHAPASITAEAQ
jgi:hypothetical protein